MFFFLPILHSVNFLPFDALAIKNCQSSKAIINSLALLQTFVALAMKKQVIIFPFLQKFDKLNKFYMQRLFYNFYTQGTSTIFCSSECSRGQVQRFTLGAAGHQGSQGH